MVSAEFQLSMLKASLDFDPHIVGSQVLEEEEEEEQEQPPVDNKRKHRKQSLGESVRSSRDNFKYNCWTVKKITNGTV